MRVGCALRDLRGRRSLSEMARQTGVSAGILSQIERGRMLPTDAQVPALEAAYGAPAHGWYTRATLLVIQPDEPAS